MSIPTYDNLFNSVLKALNALGDSGSISEIDERVSGVLNLTEEEASEIYKGNRTRLNYLVAWALTYLKG